MMPYYRDLQESLEYWNQEAPEGATHYAPRARQWYKKVDGQWSRFNTLKGQWQDCGASYPAVVIAKPDGLRQ